MKILIPMLSLGPHGGNRVLIELANRLVYKGVSVKIITTPIYKESKYELDNRVSVDFIGFGKSKANYYILLIYLLFSRWHDLVVVNHFSTFLPSIISSFLYRKITVNFVQDLEYNFHNGFSKYIAKAICFFSYKVKHLISANDYLSRKLEGFGNSVELKVNVGVSDSFFDCESSAPVIKEYDVLHFARSQPHKRLDFLLVLVEKIKKIYPEFRIAFASSDEKAIQIVNSSGYECFTPKSDKELISLIDSCKFYFLVSKHEGFSLPPLECMARGVPLLYFPCGGPSVYVDNNNSIVLDESNIDDAIALIVSSIQSPAPLSEYAKATAKKYRMSTAVDDISNFLIKVLTK